MKIWPRGCKGALATVLLRLGWVMRQRWFLSTLFKTWMGQRELNDVDPLSKRTFFKNFKLLTDFRQLLAVFFLYTWGEPLLQGAVSQESVKSRCSFFKEMLTGTDFLQAGHLFSLNILKPVHYSCKNVRTRSICWIRRVPTFKTNIFGQFNFEHIIFEQKNAYPIYLN